MAPSMVCSKLLAALYASPDDPNTIINVAESCGLILGKRAFRGTKIIDLRKCVCLFIRGGPYLDTATTPQMVQTRVGRMMVDLDI